MTGRPKPVVALAPLGFRLPVTLIARLDAYCAAITTRTGGHSISRTDAVRVLLDRALTSEGFGPQPPKSSARRSR